MMKNKTDKTNKLTVAEKRMLTYIADWQRKVERETIPSYTEMCEHFGISRQGVHETVRVLRSKGCIAVGSDKYCKILAGSYLYESKGKVEASKSAEKIFKQYNELKETIRSTLNSSKLSNAQKVSVLEEMQTDLRGF